MDLYCGFVPNLLGILWIVGGGALVWKVFFQIQFFQELSTSIHLSLGKAGPFTLESHIHVEALNVQGFPNNYIPY